MPENVTIRNLKKIRVSAQLSFALFILEVIGQLSVFFLADVVQQHTLAEHVGIICYCVMVPCTFWVNTSNTRNRITDHGWLTLFPSYIRVFTNIEQSSSQQREENSTIKTVGARLKRSKTPDGRIRRNNAKNGHVQTKNHEPDISTISHTVEMIPVSLFPAHNKTYIPEEQPSVSNCKYNASNKQKDGRCAQINLMDIDDDDDSDSDFKPHQKSRYLFLSETLISEMIININNEDAYLHYLKQLSLLNNSYDVSNRSQNDFKIIEYNEGLTPKQGKIKSSSHQMKARYNHDPAIILNTTGIQENHLDAVLHRGYLDRLEIRRKLFHDFQNVFKDENTCKVFLNKVFDIEESLITV